MRRLISRGRTEVDAVAMVTEATGINHKTTLALWRNYVTQNPIKLRLPRFTKHCPYCGIPLNDFEQAEIFNHKRQRIKAHRLCVRTSMLLCSVVLEQAPLWVGNPKTRY